MFITKVVLMALSHIQRTVNNLTALVRDLRADFDKYDRELEELREMLEKILIMIGDKK